ncbi:trypsin-like peptidase domain-containing protein [Sporosarcina sp. FSL K6-5500]|uniref:trypsin-like peptidase domain-containing protein n=1 Tax=Sporosarcina sp. FSL K6-5500 TaxID=2921558 RepID=UPI0030FC8F04
MSFSKIYENIAVKIKCIGEEGSGLLFKIPSQDYAHVFTAKHCLEGTLEEAQSFSKANIEILRLENGEWNSIEVIDYKLHDEADLALIIVKSPENLEEILLAEKNYRENVTIYGFPQHTRSHRNPAESFDANLLKEQSNIIELKTEYDLSTFDRGAATYLPGFSGSGVFIETTDRKIALVGIFTEIKDRQVAYRTLNAESIEQFNEIIASTEYQQLPMLKPDYILKKVFPHAKFLSEWKKDERLNSTEWIDSERNRLLINDIHHHFFNNDEINILHLVGRSGIGKTRSTLQACSEKEELSNVLYFNSYVSFIESVNKYIFDPYKRYHFVIDDITINEWESLNRMFSLSNIRVITLGVSPEHKIRAIEGLRIIEQPSDEDIISLIQSVNPFIDPLGRENISRLCDKDLRLLILLLNTYHREQSLTSMLHVGDRFSSIDSTLDRILHQFASELGDINEFKKYYSKLCLLIDIGIAGEYKKEIIYLSDYFGLNQQSMFGFIDKASKCWLGLIKNEFFETLPRALSRYIFENDSWSFVKNDLSNFINGMPTNQMKKRFINRVEECHETFRQEVGAELSAWFLETFSEERLELLNNVDNAKVFKVYTEFAPEIGLGWLKRTLKRASSEELLNFKGNGGFLSSNKERRYIVWLCEHLACFKEYFWACEEVLFILAQNETELHISNNSKGVWTGLFTPILSNTEAPFEGRYSLLMKRLKNSTILNIDLMLDAIVPVFNGVGMKMVPPKVIGGRVVPQEWRPATEKELYDLKIKAMKTLVSNLRDIQGERIEISNNFIIKEFRMFVDYGAIEDLKDIFRKYGIQEETEIKLKNAIEELLYSHDKYGHFVKNVESLKDWLDELSDSSFDALMKGYLLGDYWGNYHRKGELAVDGDIDYLAKEVLKNNISMDSYLELVGDTQNNIFLQKLMRRIGFLDMKSHFKDFIINCIKEDKDTIIIIAYLQGLVSKECSLPDIYKSLLDEYEEKFPNSILSIVIDCEINNSGYDRLLRIIQKDMSLIRSLLPMQYGTWNEILSNSQMYELFLQIESASSDILSRYIILKLAHGYHRQNAKTVATPEMSVLLTKILLECLIDENYKFDDWDWQQVFEIVSEELIDHKISLLVVILKSKKAGHSNLEHIALEYLKKFAKEGYSEYVMSSLGTVMLNDNNYIFYLHVYRGLFESIEIEIVKKWVEENGINAARALARHIESPASKGEDKAYVPPLTEWILSTYEWDDRLFREFIAGRHSFEVINISEAIENYENLKVKMEPYLNHGVSRVRQWAEYEIKQSEGLQKDEQIRRTREEREY